MLPFRDRDAICLASLNLRMGGGRVVPGIPLVPENFQSVFTDVVLNLILTTAVRKVRRVVLALISRHETGAQTKCRPACPKVPQPSSPGSLSGVLSALDVLHL